MSLAVTANGGGGGDDETTMPPRAATSTAHSARDEMKNENGYEIGNG